MSDTQQQAGRAWILARLYEIAKSEDVQIQSVEFLPEAKSFVEILIVRAGGKRLTEDVSAVDGRLRRLIASLGE